MNQHPTKHPPLFTKDEVVEDILENMSLDDKARIKNTPEDELVMFHLGWGQYLRNYYQMWHNKALVKSIGEEHPDDASMVIIKEVWTILQESNEPGLETPPEPPEINKNVFFQWHADKQCLEIACSRASIVMEQIDLDFAQAIADGMKVNLIQTRTSYQAPDVAPRVTYNTPNAVVTLRKYPKYKDDGEIKRNVYIEWQINGQYLAISCGGTIVAIEFIDLDFAQAIAKGMSEGLREVESYTHPDVAPRVTHSAQGVTIKLWEYPQKSENNPEPSETLKNDRQDSDKQDSDKQESALKGVVERFKRAMGSKPFEED